MIFISTFNCLQKIGFYQSGRRIMSSEMVMHILNSAVKVKLCLNLIKSLIGNDDVRHALITNLSVQEGKTNFSSATNYKLRLVL